MQFGSNIQLHSFVCPFVHSCIHILTHPLTHSFNQSIKSPYHFKNDNFQGFFVLFLFVCVFVVVVFLMDKTFGRR